MKFTPRHYAEALYETTRGLDTVTLRQVLKKFVLLLAQSGDLSKHHAIIGAYEKYRNEQEGLQEIIVTVAREHDDLSKYFERNMKLKQIMNPSLIGGAKIRIEDDVWDGSVRKKLEKLEEQLQK